MITDLAIENGDLVLQANGSPARVQGHHVILQDIHHALLESQALHHLVAEDATRIGIFEVLRIVEADPRVRPGTATATSQNGVLHIKVQLLTNADAEFSLEVKTT